MAFWNNLKFRPRPGGTGYLALDIGSSAIKLVEASVDRLGNHVLALGIAPTPANSVHNNIIVEPKLMAGAIETLVKENGVKAKQVIAAVPGRAVIMKKIQMPQQEKDELEANIEFEAQNVIPESLENVNLDHQVLDMVDGNRMEVLLVAVKKEIVDSYTETLELAGLVPAVMDVDYFALENMYEANYSSDADNGVIGLIHIGAHNTTITLLQNGISTFTGDLSTAGADFTDGLARQFNISAEAAETFKLTGLLENNQVDLDTALQPITEDFVEEIRRTITLYGVVPSEESDGLRTIFLSGGSANLAGLREQMEEKMGVPVRLTEPFRGFTVNKNIDREYLMETAPIFAIGAGLSIRRPGDR